MHLDFSNIDQSDIDSVTVAMKTGYVSTHGPQVAEFEKAMADYLGVDDCIATNSGTSALHLALIACGVGPGDEVIIPALTFIGTANAVRYTGATPVFVDVDRDTWCIDNPTMRKSLSGKTKAVIPVNLYGNYAHINRGYFWSHDHDIFIVEDGAESLGTKIHGSGYHPVPIERLCKYAIISFNGNKVMTTGGGGLIVGQDLTKIREMINPGSYDGIGYNYRMPALNAALGLSQLKRLPEFLEKKRRFHDIYVNELDGLVTFQQATPGSDPNWWFTACLFKGDAPVIQARLKGTGIPTRRIFRPLSNHIWGFPVAWDIYSMGLCLPSSTLNSEKDILTVCKAIKEIL